jgi:uncharacterized membrane protein (UPF0127 family)
VTRRALALGLVTLLASACSRGGGDRDPFASVAVVIGPADRHHCVWVANTEKERQQGLKARRDLGRRPGMLFRFTSDVTVPFTMEGTLIPLTLAWFDGRGAYVGATDMIPCKASPCPVYPPPGPYRTTLEVERGRLRALGVGPGSTLRVAGGC